MLMLFIMIIYNFCSFNGFIVRKNTPVFQFLQSALSNENFTLFYDFAVVMFFICAVESSSLFCSSPSCQ
jgi:hypothetical protein